MEATALSSKPHQRLATMALSSMPLLLTSPWAATTFDIMIKFRNLVCCGWCCLTTTDPTLAASRAHAPALAYDEVAPLGANVVEALKIVSKLEKLGLDKQKISLPKCIVLGTYHSDEDSGAILTSLRSTVYWQIICHRGDLWHQDTSRHRHVYTLSSFHRAAIGSGRRLTLAC